MKYTILVLFLNGHRGYIKVTARTRKAAAGRAQASPGVLMVERVYLARLICTGRVLCEHR